MCSKADAAVAGGGGGSGVGDDVGERDAHPALTDTIASISNTSDATATNLTSTSSAAIPEPGPDDIKTSRKHNIKKPRQAGNAAIHPSLNFIHFFSLAFLILVLVSSRPELFFFTHQVLLVSTMVHVGLARAC